MSAIRPELARRIVWEAGAVKVKYPGLFALGLNEESRPFWHGNVYAEGRPFPVIVTYPPGYPGAHPVLEAAFALPAGCPHVLGRAGGRTTLCWISSHATAAHRRWNPQRHTAATVMRAAQRWFLAFLVWQALGRWPVADAMDFR